MPIVTLTTDFGWGSGYVAEMKGRLLHARTPLTLVDIAHDVPPHDIRAASWLVGQACFAFPPDTLHLVVVDPGVGTPRGLVWARIGGQQFIAPDNGVLSWPLTKGPLQAARAIAIASHAAATFHGRDVIAPTAIDLLDGSSSEPQGHELTVLERLTWPAPRETPAGVVGEVIHIDAFGNLITNLPAALWPRAMAARRLRVGTHEVTSLVRTYGEAPRGAVVALVGSQGFIEVAVVEGSAALRLAASRGTMVALP